MCIDVLLNYSTLNTFKYYYILKRKTVWAYLSPSIEKYVSQEDVDHSYGNIKLMYVMK